MKLKILKLCNDLLTFFHRWKKFAQLWSGCGGSFVQVTQHLRRQISLHVEVVFQEHVHKIRFVFQNCFGHGRINPWSAINVATLQIISASLQKIIESK